MRKRKWTREHIIRRILECDAEGFPLTVGKPGVSHSLYQAGSRVFGSWRNALQAAGIPPERGNCVEKWPPARILTIIRSLSQRRKPLLMTQLEDRYGSMLSAARRHFGSWSKAVLASGVDPAKLRRVVPWTRERIIEAILTRALRNESLAVRSTQPRSLVEAGRRVFGSWSAALEVAGLDPHVVALRTDTTPRCIRATTPTTSGERRRPAKSWTKAAIIAAIKMRLADQKPLFATAIIREDTALYRAARRHFKNWRNALLAADLCPDDHRRFPRRPGMFEVTGITQ